MISMIIQSIKRKLHPAYIRLKLRWKLEYSSRNLNIRKKYKNALISLKDIHKGERCFIIGNGPSLTAADLSLLKNEYTFAANRIFYIFNKTDWRPTYYCAQDELVIESILDELPKVQKQCRKMFLISACYDKVNSSLIDNPDVLFFCAKYASAHRRRYFSNEISTYISGGSSITYAAIQIAVYMGFSEIYLIGVDHSYSTPSLNKDKTIDAKDVSNCYFDGMPANIKINTPNMDSATLSFLKAKEYGDAHGIKIYNATRGGKLEVFPRRQLEDILKD